MQPGHRTKGKKRYITDNDDIEDIKQMHEKKKEVLLWYYDPFSVQPTNTKKHQLTAERKCS